MFVVVSGLSSYIVCRRTSRGHLGVGMRTSLSSWLFSVFILISFAFDLDLNLLIILLVCYTIGGVGGALEIGPMSPSCRSSSTGS
jgi:hypothetical protein